MSGHNKWSQIKHKKAATDAKKSNLFSKLAKQITLAAKEGGGDPAANAALRLLMEKAKAANMPTSNVEKAVKRGTGEIAGAEIKPFLYEAYGPGGVALLIEGASDNLNRTTSEIKHLLTKLGAKWAEAGAVSYLFDKKSLFGINAKGLKKPREELEMAAIDAGAQDLRWREEEEVLEVITAPDMLDMVFDGLKEAKLPVLDSSLVFIPKTEIQLPSETEKEKVAKIIDALEEHDDVNEVFTNAKL